MKKLKLILPMLAFIMAIGFSFASIKLSNPNFDYVDTGAPSPVQIPETECTTGTSYQCQAQLVEDGPMYPIYDDENLNVIKTGDGTTTVIRLWQ